MDLKREEEEFLQEYRLVMPTPKSDMLEKLLQLQVILLVEEMGRDDPLRPIEVIHRELRAFQKFLQKLQPKTPWEEI